MRRKTYRALVIFAVIVVVLAVALAFGVRFHQKTGNDSISTDYQKPDDSIQDIEPEPESVKDYPRTDLNGEVICYSDGLKLIFECGS